MDLVLQLLFTGIGIGAVYALVALGFVLIFRATNVVNFAQGEFSMVAAYLMVVFAVDLGLAILAVVPAGAGRDGAVRRNLQSGVYYPLRHRSFLPVIIATIGASILLTNSVLAIYGPQPQVLEGWFETPGIELGAGLSRQPVSPDYRGDDRAGLLQLLVLRAHDAGEEIAGDLPGQGDGVPARHFRLHHDHDHLYLFGGARRWPGNIRELFNVVQRAIVLSRNHQILPAHITLPGLAETEQPLLATFRQGRAQAIASFERLDVEEMLRKHHGNITRAALEAHKDRRAFGRLAKKYALSHRVAHTQP